MSRLLWWLMALGVAGAQDWPQFLGPARNGVYPGAVAAEWPKGGPRVVWKKPVGQGFAGPAVAQGRVILFHRAGDRETVESLDASTGNRIWSYDYPTRYRDDFGFDEGPRAVPAVADGRIYTFGAEGTLHGLDFATGRKLWSLDTHRQFNVAKGFFGAACSPLVEGPRVLLNIGGPNGAGVVAFDAATGKTLWTATSDEAGYSSPVAAVLGGQRLALFFTRNGLAAVDPASGAVRLQFRWRSRSHASVNAAAPLVDGDQIFLSASYGTGAVLLQAQGGTVKPVWQSDDALSSHYATSVLRDGFLYGFHGRQEHGQSFRSVELRTGKVQWSADGFGAGTVTLAGDRLLILREDGELVMAPASPQRFQPLARARVLPATVRAYPALAGGYLYARNENTLFCLDLRPAQSRLAKQ